MAKNGPHNLRARAGQALAIVATCDGSVSSLSGVTLRFRLWRKPAPGAAYAAAVVDGTAAPVVEVTDAAAKEITARITAAEATAGEYEWEVRRTNAGSEAILAFGTLTVERTPDS